MVSFRVVSYGTFRISKRKGPIFFASLFSFALKGEVKCPRFASDLLGDRYFRSHLEKREGRKSGESAELIKFYR
jgi:hypothetical protein